MKLINWATVPIGVAVAYHNFIVPTNGWIASIVHPKYRQLQVLNESKTSCEIYHVSQLRLSPADQQPWLVYEEGFTVIPKWAECEYRGFGVFEYAIDYENILFPAKFGDNAIAHYKIVGLKNGWTDNPDEAIE
jgi:hypothetical protein